MLSTPQQADDARVLAAGLDGLAIDVFAGAAMHTPTDITDRALETLRTQSVDALVALGGGSTIGLSKALALRTDLPQIVIPTTYAGSEATPIIGETCNGQKITQRTLKVLPETVIYDVNLTPTLPVLVVREDYRDVGCFQPAPLETRSTSTTSYFASIAPLVIDHLTKVLRETAV